MQLVTCMLRLSGNAMHTVRKTGVTVPEIVVLRAVHGDDAVYEIVAEGGASGHQIGNVAEKKRLLELYGQKEAGAKMIETMFPGYDPRMPTTLKQIGVDLLADEDKQADADAVAHARHVARVRARGGTAKVLTLGDLAVGGTSNTPAVGDPPAPAPEPVLETVGMQPPAVSEPDDLGEGEPADEPVVPDPVLDDPDTDFSKLNVETMTRSPEPAVRTPRDAGIRIGGAKPRATASAAAGL